MGTGLSIPLPGTGRQVRVHVEPIQHHPAHPAPDHAHEGDDLSNVVVWFAYQDEGDRVARAVCPELSLVVERSHVRAAADELEMLVSDYIEDALGRNQTREQFERILPKDIINDHLTRLTRMLQQHVGEVGTAWLVGHRHVSHAQARTPST